MSGARQHILVFIAHRDRPESCARSVRAFLAQQVIVEIRVLDNGSAGDAIARLDSLLGGSAQVERLDKNLGFGAALNVGLLRWLAGASGSYAVVAAHDAIPHAGCLARLVEAMEERPKAGIVSAEVGFPHIARFTGWRGPYLPFHPRGNGFEPQDFPHGTLMMFRRECLEQIGAFDERYFAYGEEMDIGLRAWHRGWQVGVVWGAVVDNPERSVPSAAAAYLQLRNALLLVKVWKGRGWALVRSFVSFANTLRLLIWKSHRPSAFSFRARLTAIADCWLGRYGAPPLSVDGKSDVRG